MTMTDDDRHRLRQALNSTIGEEEAGTLMEHLPPTGMADLATKGDVALVKGEVALVKGEVENLGARSEARAEIQEQHHTEVLRRLDGHDAVLGELDRKVDRLADRTDRRFEKIDERFDKVDQRFDKVDQRFERIDERFDKLDQRFEKIEDRIRMSLWQLAGLFGLMLTIALTGLAIGR